MVPASSRSLGTVFSGVGAWGMLGWLGEKYEEKFAMSMVPKKIVPAPKNPPPGLGLRLLSVSGAYNFRGYQGSKARVSHRFSMVQHYSS